MFFLIMSPVLNAFSDQVWISYQYFFINRLFVFVVSLQKWLTHFLLIWNKIKNYQNQTFFNIFHPITISDLGFNGIDVNQELLSLHGELLEITLIV